MYWDWNLRLTGRNKSMKKPTKFLKWQTWLTNTCDYLNPKQVLIYTPYPLPILAWKNWPKKTPQIAQPGAKDDDDQDNFSEKSRTSVAGWTNQGCIWLSGQRLYMILARLRTISDFAFCASLSKVFIAEMFFPPHHCVSVWMWRGLR